MKLLAINGSYRGDKGYTSFLINKVLAGAESAGATCEVIHLTNKHINRCIGCFKCQKSKPLLKCIYTDKDDVKEIFEKIAQSDLIIFATPVYVFNQSSLLNQLFERYLGICNSKEFHVTKQKGLKPGLFFHHIDRNVCSKPFITLICQDNLESETHKTIHSYYETYGRFMDAPYVGKLIRRSGGLALHGKDEALKSYPLLIEIYDSFFQAGVELALNGKLSRKVMKKANQPLISLPPMIHTLMRFSRFSDKATKRIQNTF